MIENHMRFLEELAERLPDDAVKLKSTIEFLRGIRVALREVKSKFSGHARAIMADNERIKAMLERIYEK